MRMKTIVHPVIQASSKAQPMFLSDFLLVPAIDTHGTWSFRDLLSAKDLGALARWANTQEKGRK